MRFATLIIIVPANSKSRFSFVNVILLIIGVSLLTFAGLNIWQWYSHTQGTSSPPNPHKTIVRSTDKPDERPVAADAEYNAPADQPKKIIIPSINTSGFIQPVGKDQFGNVGVPTNIHFAGWYVKSVKPGEPGLSVIDGHVSSLYGTALFAKLGNLKKDDEVQVQFGDNSIRSFRVVEKRNLPEPKTSAFLLTKRDDIAQQLNLVTCGGTFNKRSDKYDNRLVVVTKRVN